jgi:IstB-like ATP binding protein
MHFYSGPPMHFLSGVDSEVRPAQIFVAVMGASNYTYAEATATQTLPDWIGEPTLADAILDRIIHNAHRLQLSGDSLRKQNAPQIGFA